VVGELSVLDVQVTADAAQVITRNGGRLYLYMGFLGLPIIERVGFKQPRRPTSFTSVQCGTVELLIQSELRQPDRLRVSSSRALPPRIRVEWDGRNWGWRLGGAVA
jgi:hypothetical protein